MENLTEDSFTKYAIGCYDNPTCTTIEEFIEDLKRFAYLKRLFGRYTNGKYDIKTCRLILNHIIIIFNVFGVASGTRMLFLKLEDFGEALVPFLVFLNTLPIAIHNINGKNIISSDIKLDIKVVSQLRQINEQS